MKYSNSTGGFYCPELHGDSIPPDAVDIDDQLYDALLVGQSLGKMISTGGDGLPELIDQPGPTAEQLSAVLKLGAQDALDASDVAVLRCYEHDVAVPAAWRTYRAALRVIVTSGQGAIPPRPDYAPGT